MQPRKHSIIESVTSTLIGLVTSFVLQLVIYPLLDIDVRFTQNITITVVFTVVSVIRGYAVRRLFNKINSNIK